MAKTRQADFLKACFIAISRPSRSWCCITKAKTGHWKFRSPLERELWAEISRESSGDGCLKREEPTSIKKNSINFHKQYIRLIYLRWHLKTTVSSLFTLELFLLDTNYNDFNFYWVLERLNILLCSSHTAIKLQRWVLNTGMNLKVHAF